MLGVFLLPGGWVRPGAEHGEQKAEASTAVFLRHATCPAVGASDEHELRGIPQGHRGFKINAPGKTGKVQGAG